MSDNLVWQRRAGASMSYYTTETAVGRIRISRVHKTATPAFRVYYPDGMQFTTDSLTSAQDAAAARVRAMIAASPDKGEGG